LVTAEVSAALTVAATVLGERPFHFETVLEAGDNAPLIFLSPHQIVIEAPVKLETEDRLWMGQVVECRPEGDQWRTVIRVEHSLSNLPELLKSVRRFE